jgi:hypothetical protein
MDDNDFHTFLVPAYKCSPFLDACLASLQGQHQTSRILISTSTPFEGLFEMAHSRGAEVFVHGPNQGMSHDWNMGLAQVKTPWVTIAHQDDTYEPFFTAELLKAVGKAKEPLSLVFTDYQELFDNKVRPRNALLRIKQVLLELGFVGRDQVHSAWAKLNCLRFGSPIPCPSVSLNLGHRPIRFSDQYRVNMDWAAWIELAHQPGGFYWIRQTLMAHCLHANSETTQGLNLGHRKEEDRVLLRRLWPAPVAFLIQQAYSLAYNSNPGN